MPNVGTEITDTRAFSGSRSLLFPFAPSPGGGHNWAEKRFSHKPLQRVWYEWMLYIPANYRHGPNPNPELYNVTNNKFFAHWGPRGYMQPASGYLQTWAIREGQTPTGDSTINWARINPSGGEQYVGGGASMFLLPQHVGMWHRIRIDLRLSDIGQSNGHMRLWRGGDLLLNVENDNWAGSTSNESDNRITNGYLLGADNGYFQEYTPILIDDFRVYDSNPGWA